MSSAPTSSRSEYTFPDGFIWSAATSAFQIEGALNEDGRSASIWDEFVKMPGKIADNSTADVACDSYHLHSEDVQLMKNIGLKQYRFSISWSRVLPTGLADSVNQLGLDYYKKLINELITNGIDPLVTLYHWDLPLALGDRGGWLNPEVVEWFGDYARICFDAFGDKVKYFVTINEPWVQTKFGYTASLHAPGGFTEHCEWTSYLAAYHMLLAHATAYHIYDREFRTKQRGQIGITNVGFWFEPESAEDEDAARRGLEWNFDWFTHPIFHEDGNYPKTMIERIAEISRQENRIVSRLPSFTAQQINFIRGSADFLGLNYYTSFMARELKPGEPGNHIQVDRDLGVAWSHSDKWKTIGPPGSWLQDYPQGFRKLLNYIKHKYNNVTVLITENGCMDTLGEELHDETRIAYLAEHLKTISLAINEDHCNVIGYTLWSLLDNFEWDQGYKFRFGIHHVDFEDADRKRTPKKSAEWYKEIIARNSVLVDTNNA